MSENENEKYKGIDNTLNIDMNKHATSKSIVENNKRVSQNVFQHICVTSSMTRGKLYDMWHLVYISKAKINYPLTT